MLVDGHDAETGSLGARDLETADSHVGSLVDMLLQHRFVIHLVDMIASQQHDEFRIIALDDVDVLEDRVGGATIPVLLGNTLTGWQNVETLVALGAKKTPAALQMADQAMGLVRVATAMRRMPEFSAFDSAKSMMRDLPPKYTAGFARRSYRGWRSSARRKRRPAAGR